MNLSEEELLVRHHKYLEYQINRWQKISPSTMEELNAYYNDNLYLYELICESNFGIVYLIEPFIKKGGKILDFGSGIGTHGLYFLKKGYEVTFADIKSPHFDYIRWYTKKNNLNARFIELDGCVDLQIKDTYDAIFCFDVLEHLLNWKEVLSSFYKSLSPSGKLFIIVSFRRFEGDSLHVHHISQLTLENFNSYMQDLGFKKIFHRENPLCLTHPLEPLLIFSKKEDLKAKALDYNFKLGLKAKNNKDYQRAKRYFSLVLKQNEHDLAALHQLAEVFLNTRELLSAKRCLDKILSLIPEDYKAWEHLGDVYLYMGSLAEAIKCYATAITIRPRLATHSKKRLYCLRNSLSLLEYSDFPSWIERINLLNFFLDYNLYSLAKKLLGDEIKKYPLDSYPGFLFRKELARFYRETRRYQLSLMVLKSLKRAHPHELWVYFDIGLTYLNMGNPKLALFFFEKELELTPFKSSVFKEMGVSYRILKRYKRSLAYLTLAIEFMAEDYTAYLERAITFKEMKKFREALKDLDSAAKLTPNDESLIHFERGMLFKKKRNFFLSLREFYKALDKDPRIWNNFSFQLKMLMFFAYLRKKGIEKKNMFN